MSNKNPNEISKLWKNAVDWPCHDGPHTYNGIHPVIDNMQSGRKISKILGKIFAIFLISICRFLGLV